MKAIIFKGKINIVPKPREIGFEVVVLMKKALSKSVEPLVYATINEGQKVYELPCERRNIKALYIRKRK